MKAIRSLKLVNCGALVALALCLSAGLAMAQNAFEGKFTIPFETQWGDAVLPAGDYTISIPATAAPYRLFVRGENKTVIIQAVSADSKQLSDRSALTLVSTGGRYSVRALEAGPLGLTFDYPTPKPATRELAGVKVPLRNTSASASAR